jgi:hypothetical protein
MANTTHSFKLLSGSTNGQPILVVATSDPGTTIHTAVSGTSSIDVLRLYVHNTSGSAVNLTIEFGGNSTQNLITASIPPTGSGMFLIVDRLPLQNSLVVKAYAGTANVLAVSGYVDALT